MGWAGYGKGGIAGFLPVRSFLRRRSHANCYQRELVHAEDSSSAMALSPTGYLPRGEHYANTSCFHSPGANGQNVVNGGNGEMLAWGNPFCPAPQQSGVPRTIDRGAKARSKPKNVLSGEVYLTGNLGNR